jgi:putative ABC transport system substrate-binding protein
VRQTLELTVRVFEVREAKDLAAVFDAARKAKSDAVLQLAAPFFSVHRRAFVELSLKHRLPTGCEQAQFVELGCLISYGPDFPDMYRRAAVYVDKILKGAKPANLPIEQASTFALALNVKTAKALGIRVPESVLARADRVIE